MRSLVPLVCLLLADVAIGCDIIVRVKSRTSTPFRAQVIAPNGQKSEMQLLNNNGRLTFQEKADVCGLGEFQIRTFPKDSDKEKSNVKVTLNGIGTVNYEVKDDLVPKQVSRQGAECSGQCAPLAAARPPSRKATTKTTPKP